jgi:hypothetical protein
MSDTSQGPGWWEASDGKWYPPEQAPGAPAADSGAAGYQAAPGYGAQPQAQAQPQGGYQQEPGYGQTAYGQPVYGYAPGQQFNNGPGTAGMVLGIIGLVLFWFPFLGFLLGLLGAIFGGVGISKANKGEANNKGMAVAGLVCGILAMAIWVVFWLAVVSSTNT